MKKVEPGKIVIISEKECKELLTSEKVLEITERALSDYSKGIAINPIKLHLPLFPENNGWINSMPSWLKRQNVTGVKWVNVHGDNPKHKLPTVVGTCVLNDPATGIPFAVVDGTYVTASRTGAAASIMAKYCARKNSRVLSIIGAGVQGSTAMVMMGIAMPQIEEVRIMDIRPEAVNRLIEKGKELYPQKKYVGYEDMAKACAGADIVIIAAHGVESEIIDNVKLDKGITVIGIGQWISTEQRSKFDRVIFDFIDCVVHRANQAGKYRHDLYGEPYAPMAREIADGEIGDVINGKIPGRQSDDQVIFCFGVGMSVEDISVAYEAYERAMEKGVGTTVQLFNTL